MGQKSKLKKIKKMVYKKAIEQDEKEMVEENSSHSSDIERFVLDSAIHPPYQVILDTNFINDCIRKKMDLKESILQCLDGDVNLLVPECVFGELEKLGRVYRLALNMIKSLNITKLICQHKGTYADDCIINRVKEFKCYIVATSDVNLRQRIKKVSRAPIVYFKGHRCATERFAGDSYY